MKNKIIIGVISLLVILSLLLALIIDAQNKQIDDLKLNHTMSVNNFERILDETTTNGKIALAEKNLEIDRLNKALDTAFKNYEIIHTMLDKEIDEWNPDLILEADQMLDSIPSGSWFESGHYVTAPFGSTQLSGTFWGARGHRGVDIKPNSGNPYEKIHSVMAGRVITWGRNDRLFGNYLVIESLDGLFQIKLAHLSSIAIFNDDGSYDLYEGMEFKKGARIATMGNTGHTTGPHLHAEYYILDNGNWRLLNASAILDYMED